MPHSTTIVTVLCSCYNHAEYVCKSIESVLNQSHDNIQLIVIDDFSSDNSVEVIENFILNFPEIIFIKNKKNIGLTQSVTNALQYVTGEYFIDLAADDILLPNCIEIQLNTFKTSKFTNLAMVYGNAENITEDGNHFSYYFEVDEHLKSKISRPSGDIYSKVISSETVLCSVSSMYKKSVFDALNGYDTTLSYEDFDYWIRASRAYNIEYIDAVLVQKRITPNSLHASFYLKKNKNSNSTYIILRKAYKLNRNKSEHKILIPRVNIEIRNSFRTQNYLVMLKNCYLRLRLGLKTL
ncbi:glycosyltransferase family 2 protein [Flavobacterium agrisoli]|uniref:Glycosyltransferase n=1 Tax=Flavobacterium agrisoli TaxID=2793066 RepID=A0A934PJZ6_9FLAO|nr:glycosyltransferase [Flavobacterium agrisoli]MBK0368754.1 glycosyltransferase [Flavobacterium agrisoli]